MPFKEGSFRRLFAAEAGVSLAGDLSPKQPL